MKLRILTLPFDLQLGRFDDEPLRQFLADKELVAVKDHFFVHQGLPCLVLVLTYTQVPVPAARPRSDERSERRDAWRELLEPTDLPLFNTLREWRTARAREDGIPPYVICTNRQLAEVIRARPQTLAGLGEIDGFGQAKLKKYGSEIIAYLRPAAAEDEPRPPQETPAEGEENHDD